jgi:hypothetical protein
MRHHGTLLLLLLATACAGGPGAPDGSPIATATLELELTPSLPLLSTETDVAIGARDTSAYASLVRTAVQRLEGASPARIGIASAELAVWTPGQWSTIDQIIGDATVSIHLNATWIPFASATSPRGPGPVSLHLADVATHLALPLSPKDADEHPLELLLAGPPGNAYLHASWTYADTHLKLILHLEAYE